MGACAGRGEVLRRSPPMTPPAVKDGAAAYAPLLPEHEPAEGSVPPASVPGAVFNLSTSIVGAGIMSIPATMKVLGVAPALALIAAVALLCDASVEFLLRYTGDAAGSAAPVSYAGVMGESFGECGAAALQVCVVLTNVGALIMYLIIIGDVLSGNRSEGAVHLGVLQEWFGEHWWNSREVVLLLTLLFVLLPLLLLRRVGKLLGALPDSSSFGCGMLSNFEVLL
uniref:Sodium-coupled neutral amino acid transporter 3 n=1 Tax=Anthurium amnicola TaxID=1678845 RepID=A0A1D1YH12_9ARAE